MVQFKSRETVLNELQAFIRAYNRLIDTGQNSLTKDFVLTPMSVGGEIVFDQLQTVYDLFILSQETGADLELEATNYGLERSTGTLAVATEVFYTPTAPTVDVLIPAGSSVSTAGTSLSSPVSFTTVADYSVALANIAAYYSYDRGRYEFPVRCTADAVGSSGNVGSGTIITLNSPVSQISGVTNLVASSGGADTESDEDLRSRIQAAMTGRDLNTVNGLRAAVRKRSVVDAFPIRVEDADSERANGVDVFIIDSYVASATQTFTYSTAVTNYYFDDVPVYEVTSVVSPAGPLSSADYDVHLDNTTSMRRSIYASDYISIRASASLTPGTQFTVTYTYNADVYQLQNYFYADANKVLTANVLIKRAYPLELNINASLTLQPNADGPTTRNKVKNALIQYLSNFRLKQGIQESDLILVLQQGYGDFTTTSVDAVIINSFYLTDEFGVITNPVGQALTVSRKQYIVPGTFVVI